MLWNTVPALLLAVITLGDAPIAAAQTPGGAAANQATGCEAQLEWAADWAKRNYSGYEDKAGARPREYDSLMTVLRGDARTAASDEDCNPILGRWVAFFRDGHLGFGRPRAAAVSQQSSETPEAIRARFADWPRIDIDEATLLAQLSQRPTLDPLEGIWESADGSYRVGVVSDGSGELPMTILRADSIWWTPGQVKARLRRDGEEYDTRFYMRDHSEQVWRGAVLANVLRFGNGSTWIRDWPRSEGELSPAAYRATLNTRFHARELERGTVLVQLPTFNDPRRIDSLFQAEGKLIRGARRLIVDVRGNGGGSDYNFRMLVPLLYTGPVKMISSMVLVTEDNNRANEALIADTTWPAGQRARMRETLERVNRAGTRWYVYPDRYHHQQRVLTNPRRVAVIADSRCASSCEQFLLLAKRSRKTRIYGSNSAGIIDYGNVRRADMPGTTLTLWHPTTRTKRIDVGQGVDGVGIPPHEAIPLDEADPIGWVLRRMK
jgi:hypothetical protein